MLTDNNCQDLQQALERSGSYFIYRVYHAVYPGKKWASVQAVRNDLIQKLKGEDNFSKNRIMSAVAYFAFCQEMQTLYGFLNPVTNQEDIKFSLQNKEKTSGMSGEVDDEEGVLFLDIEKLNSVKAEKRQDKDEQNVKNKMRALEQEIEFSYMKYQLLHDRVYEQQQEEHDFVVNFFRLFFNFDSTKAEKTVNELLKKDVYAAPVFSPPSPSPSSEDVEGDDKDAFLSQDDLVNQIVLRRIGALMESIENCRLNYPSLELDISNMKFMMTNFRQFQESYVMNQLALFQERSHLNELIEKHQNFQNDLSAQQAAGVQNIVNYDSQVNPYGEGVKFSSHPISSSHMNHGRGDQQEEGQKSSSAPTLKPSNGKPS